MPKMAFSILVFEEEYTPRAEELVARLDGFFRQPLHPANFPRRPCRRVCVTAKYGFRGDNHAEILQVGNRF